MDGIDLGQLAKEIGRDQAIKIAVEQLGMREDYAEFAIAIALKEVDGDLIEIDSNA